MKGVGYITSVGSKEKGGLTPAFYLKYKEIRGGSGVVGGNGGFAHKTQQVKTYNCIMIENKINYNLAHWPIVVDPYGGQTRMWDHSSVWAYLSCTKNSTYLKGRQ